MAARSSIWCDSLDEAHAVAAQAAAEGPGHNAATGKPRWPNYGRVLRGDGENWPLLRRPQATRKSDNKTGAKAPVSVQVHL